MSDIQTHIEVDHNPRPNEIALREYLDTIAPGLHTRIVVDAGHIHNYERFRERGITFLISGGGGAKPHPVPRGPEDLYTDQSFPNYHYVKFVFDGSTVKGSMIRIADPLANEANWELKDSFNVQRCRMHVE